MPSNFQPPRGYKAILQLRNPTDEVIDAVDAALRRKNKHVLQANEVVHGVDIYLDDQKAAQNIGRELQQRFGGEMLVSAKLYSFEKQSSKKVYRLNVLFRLMPFKKGETVEIRGRRIKVLSIGKDIYGTEENTGRKVHVKFKDAW